MSRFNIFSWGLVETWRRTISLLSSRMNRIIILIISILCLLSIIVNGESGYQVGVGIWDMTGPSVEVYIYILLYICTLYIFDSSNCTYLIICFDNVEVIFLFKYCITWYFWLLIYYFAFSITSPICDLIIIFLGVSRLTSWGMPSPVRGVLEFIYDLEQELSYSSPLPTRIKDLHSSALMVEWDLVVWEYVQKKLFYQLTCYNIYRSCKNESCG